MQSISNDNFGPLIAYLLPGATVLISVSPSSPTLEGWFATSPATAPTIGGFLYITIASIAVGVTLNAFRWLLVDTIHGLTGLPIPMIDFGKLGENVEAFSLLVESHYRHYQFYANMLIATAMGYSCYRWRRGDLSLGWIDLGIFVTEVVFFVTSRDTLRKYYSRTVQLLEKPGPVSRLISF